MGREPFCRELRGVFFGLIVCEGRAIEIGMVQEKRRMPLWRCHPEGVDAGTKTYN